jgi:hypothetical protein
VAAEMGRFKVLTLCCLMVFFCSPSPCRPAEVVRGRWRTAVMPPVRQRGGGFWWADRFSAAAVTSSSWTLASLVSWVKSPLYPILKRFDSELIHAGGICSIAIFCRYGGASSTSRWEAILRSDHGCSSSLLYEMIRSPWRRGTVAAYRRRKGAPE